jgi:glycosyltransferase involved in cell wall biosynthesis
MLNYEFPPLGGGAANANKYILEAFSKYKDVKIDLITSSQNEYQKELFSENITLYKLDVSKDQIHHWTQTEIIRYSYKAYRLGRKLTSKVEYDLVHAWFGVPCGVIAQRLGLPYIVALRGSDVPGYNERFSWQYKVLKPIIKHVWNDADAVIANSRQLRELAYQTKEMKIDVIPNGVAVDEFEPTYHDHERIQVLCVSRLVKRKGVSYLIQAAAETDIELTIVGEGKQEDKLQNMVEDYGIEDRVNFTGYVSHGEIHKYYEKSDIFVLPSFNEGMSNTVLEALAAGLPVVITETGGTNELIDRNGKIIPCKDSAAIADAIRTYNKDQIKEHGKRSREIAEKMSWENVVEDYMEVYTKISE